MVCGIRCLFCLSEWYGEKHCNTCLLYTSELRQELLQLLEQKTVMATVYLADLYEVREEPDADSAVEGSLPSGSQVLLKDVAIDGGSVW